MNEQATHILFQYGPKDDIQGEESVIVLSNKDQELIDFARHLLLSINATRAAPQDGRFVFRDVTIWGA